VPSARALGPSIAAALRVGGFQPGRLQFSRGHSHPPARRQIKVNKTTLRATLAAGAALVVATSLVAAGSAQASTLPTLTLTLSKSSIAVGGSTQSGAVNVVSTASGLKEPSAILFLLKPGVSVAEVESAMKSGVGKDPNNTSKYGSIVFDTEVPPGKSSEAQTNLQPGQYLALIPGEGKGSEAHTAFTVVAAKSPATLPTPQATIRSIEFGFRGPKTLHDGEVVRFENEGFLVHMDVAFPVKSKSAATKVVKALLAGKEKGLEKLAAGAPFEFAGPVSHEAFQQETITAKPGWYVQACFMETQDGRDHTRLGMERIIKIVK
jgi:hypothetical protein